ncbi:MAG: hypothetical protein H6850_03335 [Alphaproteobacteria bacterium]|nr:MAG: hypothetical protein H6850_03335 [Alphaproteobacteria bacterium]
MLFFYLNCSNGLTAPDVMDVANAAAAALTRTERVTCDSCTGGKVVQVAQVALDLVEGVLDGLAGDKMKPLAKEFWGWMAVKYFSVFLAYFSTGLVTYFSFYPVSPDDPDKDKMTRERNGGLGAVFALSTLLDIVLMCKTSGLIIDFGKLKSVSDTLTKYFFTDIIVIATTCNNFLTKDMSAFASDRLPSKAFMEHLEEFEKKREQCKRALEVHKLAEQEETARIRSRSLISKVLILCMHATQVGVYISQGASKEVIFGIYFGGLILESLERSNSVHGGVRDLEEVQSITSLAQEYEERIRDFDKTYGPGVKLMLQKKKELEATDE